jgi:hypothetical protein
MWPQTSAASQQSEQDQRPTTAKARLKSQEIITQEYAI